MNKVILLEDDFETGRTLAALLKYEGFDCTHCVNSEDLRNTPKNEQDIFILDFDIKGKPEGLDAAKYLRDTGVKSPVIMLTSETSQNVIIDGFNNAGIDEYLLKPINIKELTARLRRQISSNPIFKSKVVLHNNLKLSLDDISVHIDDQPVFVTPSEFKILHHLLENKGKIVHRKKLIEIVNEQDIAVSKRTIDTHINGIRNKIPDSSVLITARRGFGYGIV